LTTRKRASSREGTFAPQIAPAPRSADSGLRRNDEKNNVFPIFVSPANAGVQFRVSIGKDLHPMMFKL
jgi:hypothetical protein